MHGVAGSDPGGVTATMVYMWLTPVQQQVALSGLIYAFRGIFKSQELGRRDNSDARNCLVLFFFFLFLHFEIFFLMHGRNRTLNTPVGDALQPPEPKR